MSQVYSFPSATELLSALTAENIALYGFFFFFIINATLQMIMNLAHCFKQSRNATECSVVTLIGL